MDGILALQGDYFAHGRVLDKLGRKYVYVKTPQELSVVSSLIIPGGESSTIKKLAITGGLWEPLKKFNGPILGTCAGIILLASKVINPDDESLNRLDITISRNAYGSQINSFVSTGSLRDGNQVEMVFIRAPKIIEVGSEVEIIAKLTNLQQAVKHRHKHEPVGVRQGNVIGLTYHPELSDDISIYEYFYGLGKAKQAVGHTSGNTQP